MSVEVRNDHPTQRVGVRRMAQHLRGALRTLGRGRAHVDVRLVTDQAIRPLNRHWRGVDRATDVLSFALQEAGAPDLGPLGPEDLLGPVKLPGPMDLLGEIVISLDAARRQARQVRAMARRDGALSGEVRRYSVTVEAMFLATHGLLHLLGHDHQEAAEADAMEALERRLFAGVTALDVHASDRTDHGLPAR